jgi:predicted alpha/beta superfamily hydrolase
MALQWHPYSSGQVYGTSAGTLLVQPDVYSPELGNTRTIFVWLPSSYEASDRHYPVIYMHDGQNLFDEAISFVGSWHVDQAMHELESQGIEAIIVGIANNDDRMSEYNPFPFSFAGPGKGEQYLDFISFTLKPMIDREFRTMPQREFTGLAGSSLGGLISLYGYMQRGEYFGLCAALSPSLWFGYSAMTDLTLTAPQRPGRLYLDIGTAEGMPVGRSAARAERASRFYVRTVRTMADIFRQRGSEVMYVEDEGGQHSEAAWMRRLPGALRFILTNLPR